MTEPYTIPYLTEHQRAKRAIDIHELWDEYERWQDTCDMPPTLINFIHCYFDPDGEHRGTILF